MKERLSRVIRDFCDHMRRGLLYIELFAPRHDPHRFIEGIVAHATRPTIEIRPLKLHRPYQGFHGATHGLSGLQYTITLRTVARLAVVFPTVDIRHDCFGDAPSELLAQVPHRGGHLRKSDWGLVPLLLESIEPLVKAGMELLAQGVPL